MTLIDTRDVHTYAHTEQFWTYIDEPTLLIYLIDKQDNVYVEIHN